MNYHLFVLLIIVVTLTQGFTPFFPHWCPSPCVARYPDVFYYSWEAYEREIYLTPAYLPIQQDANLQLYGPTANSFGFRWEISNCHYFNKGYLHQPITFDNVTEYTFTDYFNFTKIDKLYNFHTRSGLRRRRIQPFWFTVDYNFTIQKIQYYWEKIEIRTHYHPQMFWLPQLEYFPYEKSNIEILHGTKEMQMGSTIQFNHTKTLPVTNFRVDKAPLLWTHVEGAYDEWQEYWLLRATVQQHYAKKIYLPLPVDIPVVMREVYEIHMDLPPEIVNWDKIPNTHRYNALNHTEPFGYYGRGTEQPGIILKHHIYHVQPQQAVDLSDEDIINNYDDDSSGSTRSGSILYIN